MQNVEERINALTDPVLSNIKDRFKNKLVFTFVLSWLIINWHIFYILFVYDIDPSSRFKIVTGDYYIFLCNDWICYKNIIMQFIAPLFIAISYTLIFPYINNYIDFTFLKEAKSSRLSNLHDEQLDMLSREKQLSSDRHEVQLLLTGEKQYKDMKTELELSNSENSELKKTILKLKSEQDLKEELFQLNVKYDAEIIEAYNTIKENYKFTEFNRISNFLKISETGFPKASMEKDIPRGVLDLLVERFYFIWTIEKDTEDKVLLFTAAKGRDLQKYIDSKIIQEKEQVNG